MRYSKQREAILKTVLSTNNHPTADWIFRKIRKRIPNISLGTIYRNLKQLVNNHIIRVNIIDGVAHFDGKLTKHHHFLCFQCRSLYDLNLNLEELMTEIEMEKEHRIQGFNLQIRGICKLCLIKKEPLIGGEGYV